MSGGLTTHVLDTSRAEPAEGVDVTLTRIDSDDPDAVISEGTTNHDGRLEAPLLTEAELEPGTYELAFEVGAHYAEGPHEVGFLNTVPVRFVVDDPTEHYHVPLLLSPGGYTTYRGS